MKTIRETGLQVIIEKRLIDIQNEAKSKIIPFSLIIHRICSRFTITKKECWELLFHLQDNKMIEIVPFHGVRIDKLQLLSLPDSFCNP